MLVKDMMHQVQIQKNAALPSRGVADGKTLLTLLSYTHTHTHILNLSLLYAKISGQEPTTHTLGQVQCQQQGLPAFLFYLCCVTASDLSPTHVHPVAKLVSPGREGASGPR